MKNGNSVKICTRKCGGTTYSSHQIFFANEAFGILSPKERREKNVPGQIQEKN